MALRPDYIMAFEALARAFALYETATGSRAVLVGGAAAAIYTDGAFVSGDFDIIAPYDNEFTTAMLNSGFRGENRPNRLRRGFYHPDHPAYGFEQVSGHLFDGKADRKRLVKVVLRLDPVEGAYINLPSHEDMIADRLGQHAVASPSDPSRLDQARLIYSLADSLDIPYLVSRIRDEHGDPTLIGLSYP